MNKKQRTCNVLNCEVCGEHYCEFCDGERCRGCGRNVCTTCMHTVEDVSRCLDCVEDGQAARMTRMVRMVIRTDFMRPASREDYF